MTRMYIWEQYAWPEFRLDRGAILPRISVVRFKQGSLLHKMRSLGLTYAIIAELDILTNDTVQTSSIEGEVLNDVEVRSSVARRLGLELPGNAAIDKKIDGLVEMLTDATAHHERPLTTQRLFAWNAGLFPAGLSGMHEVQAGAWRADAHGPMQVVSGALGRERVHFQAPPADRVGAEIAHFLDWFNSKSEAEGLLRAAIAHLWVVTIHPFEDGNGRTARAIADMALAQSDGSDRRFYSMSSQIRKERSAYYKILEDTQKGNLDVTAWAAWFLDCLERAIDSAEDVLTSVVQRAKFWQRHGAAPMNERQRKILTLLLAEFDGKLTAPKWAKITKCSPATALRDINDLLERGILTKSAAGSKNTSYELTMDNK